MVNLSHVVIQTYVNQQGLWVAKTEQYPGLIARGKTEEGAVEILIGMLELALNDSDE